LFPPGDTLAVVASANRKYRYIKIGNKPRLFSPLLSIYFVKDVFTIIYHK